MKECECGCKRLISDLRVDNKPKRFLRGHQNKGKSNTWKMKDKVKLRTSRERALKILRKNNINQCQVDNELCNGILESHHIDKNPFNNKIINLMMLCRTHHRFADNRNMSLDELKQFKPTYMISSNKRRYQFG